MYIEELEKEFQNHANYQRALQQEKYMKNKFVFYGLGATERRKLQAPFLVKQYLPQKQEAFQTIKKLWQKPQRELHYFAQELAYKYLKKPEKTDIKLYEYLITHNSWWDTVDYIAANLVGSYFKKFPEQQNVILSKWLKSENIWLQRTCLIFQLKYKEETDTKILATSIETLNGTTEFFINKAIGWALRQYGKTNSRWVIDFVDTHELSNLSRREALRLL